MSISSFFSSFSRFEGIWYMCNKASLRPLKGVIAFAAWHKCHGFREILASASPLEIDHPIHKARTATANGTQ